MDEKLKKELMEKGLTEEQLKKGGSVEGGQA